MNRRQLEHVLRASGSISGSRDIVVIGSQAILGAHPDAPEELLRSMEADIYPLDAPDRADLIDGCIGELSPFHEAFGYYAHGVGPESAILPAGWRSRLIRLENENTGGTVGWCLSSVDLAISKLCAGRKKDVDFVHGLLRAGFLTEAAVEQTTAELKPAEAELVIQRLRLCR